MVPNRLIRHKRADLLESSCLNADPVLSCLLTFSRILVVISISFQTSSFENS